MKMAQSRSRRREKESPISLPDEREVNETKRTVPVKPRKPSRAARQPIPSVALDRRKQLTDENSTKKSRRK
jgi:hypothetical protein